VSDLSDRLLSSMSFRLFNNTRSVFRLVFQHVTDPVQQFPCNFDDRLGLSHPFTILLESLHHHRVLPYGNPGGFNQQPPQLRMTSLGKPSHVFFLTTSLSIRDQSYVTAQWVNRPKRVISCNSVNTIMAVRVLIPGIVFSNEIHERYCSVRAKATMARLSLAMADAGGRVLLSDSEEPCPRWLVPSEFPQSTE